MISGFKFHMYSKRFVSLEVLVTLYDVFCVGNNTNMDWNPNRNLVGLSPTQRCVIRQQGYLGSSPTWVLRGSSPCGGPSHCVSLSLWLRLEVSCRTLVVLFTLQKFRAALAENAPNLLPSKQMSVKTNKKEDFNKELVSL